MRKTLALAALLAATAFTPAHAQEEPEQIGRIEARVDRGGPRNEGFAGRGDRGGDRGGQVQRAERIERQQARPQPQRSENTNGGEWQGRRGGGGWQGTTGQAAPVAPVFQPPVAQSAPPAQAAEPRMRGGMNNEGGWQGRGRGNGDIRDPNRTDRSARPDWDRGNAPSARAGGNPVAPPVIADRNPNRGNDGRWNNGNRRDEASRNDGWRGTDWNRNREVENRSGQRWGESRDWNGRVWSGDRQSDSRSWNNRQWNDGRAWNRDWRRDQRYDWQRWRYTNRDAFRVRPYYAPYEWNYGYRRFSIGWSLSTILFDQRYWIDDPYAYRLPPAYGAYRWVRYYDDVLLVDVRTGRVVDVIYDFFW